jgi:Gamma-glutamyl cyclotransferase, AIG2-like
MIRDPLSRRRHHHREAALCPSGDQISAPEVVTRRAEQTGPQGAREFVFGYGSLVARHPGLTRRSSAPSGYVTDLRGFTRGWTVSADNTLTLPGYKLYRTEDGSRPAVCVAFLDIRQVADSYLNGVCHPIVDSDLADLDERERQYDRVDVTGSLDRADGRIWAYVGCRDSRARTAAARASGRLVVSAGYLATVRGGFARLAPGELETFDLTTDPVDIPVLQLERTDVP